MSPSGPTDCISLQALRLSSAAPKQPRSGAQTWSAIEPGSPQSLAGVRVAPEKSAPPCGSRRQDEFPAHGTLQSGSWRRQCRPEASQREKSRRPSRPAALEGR